MNLSPYQRLYLACTILSLFSLSAFIANNSFILLFNHFGVAVILWVRLIRPQLHMSKLEYFNVGRILIPTCLFITTLSFGLFFIEENNWCLVATAAGTFIISYRFPFYLITKR